MTLNLNKSSVVPPEIKSELLFLFFFAAFSFTCLMCTCEARSHVWISLVVWLCVTACSPPPANQSHYTLTVPLICQSVTMYAPCRPITLIEHMHTVSAVGLGQIHIWAVRFHDVQWCFSSGALRGIISTYLVSFPPLRGLSLNALALSRRRSASEWYTNLGAAPLELFRHFSALLEDSWAVIGALYFPCPPSWCGYSVITGLIQL